jgi:hypothetical protein
MPFPGIKEGGHEMERVLFIVVGVLVSSAAFAGRAYDSDADEQFHAPIQAYDEIRGKCYPEKLQGDDPDPVQYVEIIFRNELSKSRSGKFGFMTNGLQQGA